MDFSGLSCIICHACHAPVAHFFTVSMQRKICMPLKTLPLYFPLPFSPFFSPSDCCLSSIHPHCHSPAFSIFFWNPFMPSDALFTVIFFYSPQSKLYIFSSRRYFFLTLNVMAFFVWDSFRHVRTHLNVIISMIAVYISNLNFIFSVRFVGLTQWQSNQTIC